MINNNRIEILHSLYKRCKFRLEYLLAFLTVSIPTYRIVGDPLWNISLDEMARLCHYLPIDVFDIKPPIFNDSEALPADLPQAYDLRSWEQAPNCKGLIVGSAYIEPFQDNLTIHMTTGYEPWKSYTPFGSNSVRCSLASQMGGYLKTYKHYSSCSIPHKATVNDRELIIDIIDIDSSSLCKIKAITLDKHHLSSRYTLSALTTVRNSAKYFREWLNFGFCTGWSHFYLYDDASDGYMQQILISLRSSGHLTYTNWSHVHDHGSRQFMAMQDFLIRFRHETLYVSQMDDDCYFLASRQFDGPSINFTRAIQNYFDLSDQEHTCQIQISSYWFGHSWTTTRSKPLELSSFLRANTSLSSRP